MTFPPDHLPIRVQINHPETDEPMWLETWDGTNAVLEYVPDLPPDPDRDDDPWSKLVAWGGRPIYEDECGVFATWHPAAVAFELLDNHGGAGFDCTVVEGPDVKTMSLWELHSHGAELSMLLTRHPSPGNQILGTPFGFPCPSQGSEHPA